MTYYGARYLLKKAYDDVEFLQFDSRRAEQEKDTYVPQYNWGDDVEIILLAGTPWLGVEKDLKVLFVQQALKRWATSKKIALGIGAFLSFRRLSDKNSYSDIDTSFLRNFDLVLTRDMLAHNLLLKDGISNFPCCDTSIYSSYYLPRPKCYRHRNIVIYYDPLANNVFDHMPESYWQMCIEFQLEWAKRKKAEIITITSGDAGSLIEKGIYGRFVTDLEWLAERMSEAKSVLSGRVHQAILAKIMGCPKVVLIPVDSRYLTVEPLGIDVLSSGYEVEFPLKAESACSLPNVKFGDEQFIIKKLKEVWK